jgi:hypothetical protein
MFLAAIAAVCSAGLVLHSERDNAPDDRSADASAAAGRAVVSGPETPVTAAVESGGTGTVVDGRDAADGCELTTHYLPVGDGTTAEVYTCEGGRAAEPHPYESYSNAALESLAYSDAQAAEVLGMRLRESDERAAMSLVFRSAALSGGDAEPIVKYSNAYPRPTAVDGVPDRRTVHVKYVLSAVTQLLGDDRHSLPYYTATIRDHSADPDREIAMLDERARQIVEEMRQIELDVTGSSATGG